MMKRSKSFKGLRWVAALTVAGLMVSAVPAAGATSEPVTLVVEDVETTGRNAVMEQLNKEFMELYPNVTIERIKSDFNDLANKQALTMTGPNPPDVNEIAVSTDTFSKFATEGLIIPLDTYAEEFGWLERLPSSLLDRARFDADGQINSGALYGTFPIVNLVGVFYNKDKLAELGLEVPATFEDFEAALATAKAAGEIPMMLGNLTGFSAGHALSLVMNQNVSSEDITSWTDKGKPPSYNSKPFLDTVTHFQGWGLNDYFEPEFNAVSYDDATARFGKGEGVFRPGGTWLTSNLGEALGSSVGFFPMPASATPLFPKPQIEGGGQLWAISGKSENPDVAAAYLDFMTSQRGGEILVENGHVPAFTMDPLPVIEPGVTKDVFDATQLVASSYNISPFIDTATPSMLDTSNANQQLLLVGKMTPQEMVESEQADSDAFWSKQ
jgi:raffinose/stachyose/melibiose transport system substrate-binding protein